MGAASWIWSFALLGVIVFCIAQAVRDAGAKRYVWALAGLLSAVTVLTVPVQTHAVVVDLPTG